MNATIIRAAQSYDCETLCRLYHEFHEFHVRGVPDRLLSLGEPLDTHEGSQLYETIGKIIRDENAALFVAEASGKLVGLAEVYVHQDERHPLRTYHRYGHVQSLMVSEQQRQGGIGTKLLDQAEQWAKAKGATEMRLDAWEFEDGPLHFWKKNGYRTLRRTLVRELVLGIVLSL